MLCFSSMLVFFFFFFKFVNFSVYFYKQTTHSPVHNIIFFKNQLCCINSYKYPTSERFFPLLVLVRHGETLYCIFFQDFSPQSREDPFKILVSHSVLLMIMASFLLMLNLRQLHFLYFSIHSRKTDKSAVWSL